MTYTPGPWELDEDGVVRVGRLRLFRASGALRLPLDPADARLIAAAPDLLEALEELVARCQAEDVPWAEEIDARVAIAKAKGEE